MKPIILIVTSLLFSLFSANAQESSLKKPFTFGIRAGLSFSKFTKDIAPFSSTMQPYDSSFESFLRIGGSVGFTLDYSLTDRFFIGSGLSYTWKGMSYTQKNNSVLSINQYGKREQAYNYFNYKIDYLEIPITANYNLLSPSSSTWFNTYIGLAPGLAVATGTSLIHPTITAGPWKGPADINGELNNVNKFNVETLIGLQVGGYNSHNTGFYGDLRGGYVILPVFNTEGETNHGNTGMFTGTLAFGIKF